MKLNVEDQAICLRDPKKDKDVSYTIDFLFKHKICAIATKGFDGNFVDEYRISYSIDGESWNNSNVFRREYVSTFVCYYSAFVSAAAKWSPKILGSVESYSAAIVVAKFSRSVLYFAGLRRQQQLDNIGETISACPSNSATCSFDFPYSVTHKMSKV